MAEERRWKTKIPYPNGPASESPQILADLIQAGMNVARLNFPTGPMKNICERSTIRKIADRLRQPVATGVPISIPGTTNFIKVEMVE